MELESLAEIIAACAVLVAQVYLSTGLAPIVAETPFWMAKDRCAIMAAAKCQGGSSHIAEVSTPQINATMQYLLLIVGGSTQL
jgi:hypothetical protein